MATAPTTPADEMAPAGIVQAAFVESVNLGRGTPSRHTSAYATGIDKRPVGHPVLVRDPRPKGRAGSGLAGDDVCDRRHHGGTDQAVYAFAREDLDRWAQRLGRPLPSGTFGENLTTRGLDLAQARLGERWQIGEDLLLQVTAPRIPCRTFAGWLGEQGWVRRFTEDGRPGTYLRVVRPGWVQAGDRLEVVGRPGHQITVNLAFRALTTHKHLLPSLLAAADDLVPDLRATVLARVEKKAAGSRGTVAEG